MPSTALIDLINSLQTTQHYITLPHSLKAAIEKNISSNNINDQDDNGNTALHLAVMKKQPAIIFLLVQNKARLTIENKKKQTARMLISPTSKLSLAVTKALNGGDPNETHTRSLLSSVVLDKTLSPEQQLASVRELVLDLGHDINYNSTTSVPVLHCALHYQCSIELISFLLEHGADPTIKTQRGLDALTVAHTYKCSPAILALLRSKTASTRPAPPLNIPDRLTETRTTKEQLLAQNAVTLKALGEAQQRILSLRMDVEKEQALIESIAQEQAALVSKMNPLEDQIASLYTLKAAVLNAYAQLNTMVTESILLQSFLPESSQPQIVEQQITEAYLQENFLAIKDKEIAAITVKRDALQQQYNACQAAIQQHQNNITQLKTVMKQHVETVKTLEQDQHTLQQNLATVTNEENMLVVKVTHMMASLRESIQRKHQAHTTQISASLYLPSGRLSPSVGDKRTASETSDPDDDIKRLKPTEGARPV